MNEIILENVENHVVSSHTGCNSWSKDAVTRTVSRKHVQANRRAYEGLLHEIQYRK